MAVQPFGPWRVADAEPAGDYDGPLTGALRSFADIYFYAGRLGFSPPEVDEWYVWQTAVVLGAHRPDDGPETPRPGGSGPGPGSPDSESLRLIRAREKYMRGEGPKPEVPAYPPEMFGFKPGSVAEIMGAQRGDH